eukprot:10236435-Alexandrium_andersonii.AAC.1
MRTYAHRPPSRASAQQLGPRPTRAGQTATARRRCVRERRGRTCTSQAHAAGAGRKPGQPTQQHCGG